MKIKWLADRIKTKQLVVASAPLSLEVTKADIAGSKTKDPENCAFSCAVKRGLGAQGALFLRSTAYIEYADRVVSYTMPGSMQKEIVAFDRARAMEPGVYRLSPSSNTPERKAAKRTAAKRRRAKKRRTANGKQGAKPNKATRPKSKVKANQIANVRTLVVG